MTTDGIGDVVASLQSIVETSTRRGSANGYFAAMYLGVTQVVEQGLAGGIFSTPERLARLTVVFARRYVDAWQAHDIGEPTSESWDVAFRAADRWRPTVLQHLLVGMNAHINLDLGVASAEVARGTEINDLRPDFDEINNVLAGLVGSVQRELNRVSPLYRFVDDVAGPVDRAVVNFSIARARAEAWKLATVLAAGDRSAATERIAEQDRAVAALGERIIRPGIVTSTGLFAVRVTEKRRPADIIAILNAPADRQR